MSSQKQILLTGATGYVGGQLLPVLLRDGHRVRCLVRDPARADLPGGAEVVRGDVRDGPSLEPALDGVDVAFYLVPSMTGPDGDFAAADREAARMFGRRPAWPACVASSTSAASTAGPTLSASTCAAARRSRRCWPRTSTRRSTCAPRWSSGA